MEKDYLVVYNNNYELEKRNYSLFIKDLIIDQKEYKTPFNIVYQIIQDYHKLFSENHIIYNEVWNELTEIFRYRSKYIEEESDMEIINGLMFSAYQNLITNKTKYSYENYILELSKYYAQYEVTKIFESNNHLTRLMYAVNDFSECNFEGHEKDELSKLLLKYKSLKDGVPINEGFDILSKKGINNFCTENESYKNLFESENFYDFLIMKNYIDYENTTFLQFQDVFIKDFNSNESIVQFECTTKKASVFLKEMQIRFIDDLSFINIEYSQKFKSSLGNLLKRSNISEAFTKSSKELKDRVNNDLDSFLSKKSLAGKN
jgi:hypothetical protein